MAKLPDGQPLPGEVAFKLYDTYGFPLDLTQDILRGQELTLDSAGFDAAMERQRDAARKAWAGSGEAATDKLWFELRDKLGATEFLGYSTEMAEGKVIALILDGKPVERAAAGAKIALHRQPDAVLRRIRRPDGRPWHHVRAARARRSSSTTPRRSSAISMSIWAR